ncbi:MAG: hypothetical protein QOF62_291 [Pyrinomonadaceae bacterium]|jgi:hypothetical protein|nr:hypothetical protein [Pyrinomonadaceae bacterium]
MTNRRNLRVLSLCLLVAFLLLAIVPKQILVAQEQRRKFTPGEMVETGGGISAKILRCRGAGENEECEVQYYRGDDLESTPRWENTSFLRTAEERVLNGKKRQAGQPENAGAETARPQPLPPAEENKTDNNVQPGDCSFTPPPADTSKTARASEQLFKRKIYDAYHLSVDGTNSAPLKLGVTFLSFLVSKPFTNIVRVDPAVGAYRINDAAPVNAIIYPVKSEHIVCEQYRDRTLRKRVANKYACFKNRDGEWVCGADGMPKITQLN